MGCQGAGGPPARCLKNGKHAKRSMFSVISQVPWEVRTGADGRRREHRKRGTGIAGNGGKRALSSAELTSSGHTWGRPAQPFSSARSAKHGATQAEEKRERADLSHGCTERIRSAFGTVRPTNKHEPDGSRTE